MKSFYFRLTFYLETKFDKNVDLMFYISIIFFCSPKVHHIKCVCDICIMWCFAVFSHHNMNGHQDYVIWSGTYNGWGCFIFQNKLCHFYKFFVFLFHYLFLTMFCNDESWQFMMLLCVGGVFILIFRLCYWKWPY